VDTLLKIVRYRLVTEESTALTRKGTQKGTRKIKVVVGEKVVVKGTRKSTRKSEVVVGEKVVVKRRSKARCEHGLNDLISS
jgi:hypothetical protein